LIFSLLGRQFGFDKNQFCFPGGHETDDDIGTAIHGMSGQFLESLLRADANFASCNDVTPMLPNPSPVFR
jgi:hypothetical protein